MAVCSRIGVVDRDLGVLFAFLVLRVQDGDANMSLGGIAITVCAMVDAALVISRTPIITWEVGSRTS